MIYVFAVLAAWANATSSVLQRKAGRRVPQQQNLSLRLVRSLAHEPVWFGGMLAVTVGFLLQAAALGSGQLSVVEPILVIGLPATLILASWVFRTRLHRREWGSAAAMTAGLAGLLYFLSPSGGHPESVRGQGSALQAAVLAVAAGAGFGLTAALIKGMTAVFSRGWAVLFTSWQLYAMIASGCFAMFLAQSAMNAGRLVAAQPGLTLTDPIVSVLWGVLVFGERVRGGWFIALALVCGLIMASAVVVLAHSPLLSGTSGDGKR
jgi:drug/metabolite transporter (DMT)-like permease